MKKKLLTILLATLSLLPQLNSQTITKDLKSSIQLSYGILNPQRILIKKAAQFTGMEYQSINSINNIYCKWLIATDRNNVNFGPSISYYYTKINTDFIDSTTGFVNKHIQDNYITNRFKFMVEFEHTVLEKKHTSLFYSVGLGLSYSNSRNTNLDNNTNYFTPDKFGFLSSNKFVPTIQIVLGASYRITPKICADAMIGNTGNLLQVGLRYHLGN